MIFRKIWEYTKKEFTIAYWIMISYFILFFIYIFSLHFGVIFQNDFSIEYKSYYNVNVDVRIEEINGKLNNYITIKNINNKCYRTNCGFLSEGRFYLSEIRFIKIKEQSFLLLSCLDNSNNNCFYNIDESFIKKTKEELFYQAKNELKWSIIIVFVVIICMYLESFARRERRLRGLLYK